MPFNDRRLMLGASWYPEMWPEDQWPLDVARMRELGFNVVRLFEFAWKRFEPSEGRFDFDWARRVLDLCHDAGIAAVVGTPTAAPPAWLTSAYPQTLQVGPDGRPHTHGQRKHYNHCSPKYRELCVRIASRMAQALGGHPAVHAWQIDNEMGGRDFSEATRALFHQWLEQRYGSVESLNRAWGLDFWSQAYDAFAQIPMPTASVGSIEVPERHHPSLIIALARFFNDEWSAFIKAQFDAIRAFAPQPITTNMAGWLGGMDWHQHNKLLDGVAYSLYADILHPYHNLIRMDWMRGERPGQPYWVLETAPNWSGGGKQWNIHHDEAGIRWITWASILAGGSKVVYWQWREHWAGQETHHGTCVTATGQWRPGRREWKRLADEFARHGDFLLAHPPAAGDIGLVLSHPAAWSFSIDPLDENMRYADRIREDYYIPLVRAGLWRDLIGEDADFSRHKVIHLPLMPMVRPDTLERLAAWVETGGTLVLGPITGTRTQEFTAPTDRTFGGLEDLIGAESALRFTVHWVEDRVRVDFEGIGSTRTRNWCEAFEPRSARPIATYRGGYGDGLPAAVRHELGRGRVIMLGCQIDASTYARLMTSLCAERGVLPLHEGDAEVLVVPRADASGATVAYAVANLLEKPQDFVLPQAGRDLLSGQAVARQVSLEPLEVMLITDLS